MLVLLGRRILDGKPGGVQGEATTPPCFTIVPKGIELLSSMSTQPAHVSSNENLLNRQTWEGIPATHRRNPKRWRRLQTRLPRAQRLSSMQQSSRWWLTPNGARHACGVWTVRPPGAWLTSVGVKYACRVWCAGLPPMPATDETYIN